MAVERDSLVQFLRGEIIQRTGVSEADLRNDELLSTLGLSSLEIVLISGALEDRFDIEVEPTLLFEYPTIDDIADRIAEEPK
ncbi:MAG: acyl carrier protein [Janthinobacterium lividum]